MLHADGSNLTHVETFLGGHPEWGPGHVIIGTTFLVVCTMRAYYGTFRADKHVGFEAAAWYWHFVDVVWLFLFVWVYWWGGSLQWTTTGAG